jgi:alanyl-tRNA synthetase
LDQTPFYGESGGQVGDTGEIVGQGFQFHVTDTQKDGDLILHKGHLISGEMRAGAAVTARVDAAHRAAIRRAHSATHILHYALQKNLGRHAQQQGSKVDRDWLRFDFTNLSAVGDDQLLQVEHDVKERIEAADPVRWDYVPLAEAREKGAMMLFGEKYPDPVRLVTMGEFSRELCGGIHVSNTRELNEFEIISEESVSTGTRRVVALTGERAKQQAQQTRDTLEKTAQLLGVAWIAVPAALRAQARALRDLHKQLTSGAEPPMPPADKEITRSGADPATYERLRGCLREAARILNVASMDVPDRTQALLAEVEQLKTRVAELNRSGLLSADALIERGEVVDGVHVVVCETPGANPNLMRQWIDQIRKKTDQAAIFLAAVQGKDKVLLVAGLSRTLIDRGLSAGSWVKEVAVIVGGGGGGRPDLAQAGGKLPEQLPAALEKARVLIREMLGGHRD